MWETWVAVVTRWLHVLAMAVLVVVPAVLAPMVRDRTVLVARLVAAERWTWVAFGTIVVTGIGNAGWLAEGWPAPRSDYGAVFLAKLILVGLLLALSGARSFVVARHAALGRTTLPPRAARMYTSSSVLGGGIAAAGVGLAHGL